MKHFALTLAACALFAHDARSEATGGTVTGTVKVLDNGKPAKRDEVYVYLEQTKPRRQRPKDSPPSREIRQEKEQFSPHVLVVPVGTTVMFPNYDRQEHNVFSPTDLEQFDLGRYNTNHSGKAHQFDSPHDVEIYCDIHKQMWARVKVVDADPRFIAKVDANGAFSFAGVPPATYKLHAWTFDSEEVIERIEVADGATVAAHEAHLQLGKTPTHLRKDGSAYPIYTH